MEKVKLFFPLLNKDEEFILKDLENKTTLTGCATIEGAKQYLKLALNFNKEIEPSIVEFEITIPKGSPIFDPLITTHRAIISPHLPKQMGFIAKTEKGERIELILNRYQVLTSIVNSLKQNMEYFIVPVRDALYLAGFSGFYGNHMGHRWIQITEPNGKGEYIQTHQF